MHDRIYNSHRREEKMNSAAISQMLGPFLLGLLINYFMWGIQVAQSYYYYRSYRKTDRAWLKAAVGLLFVVDAIQSICASEGTWHAMITSWGDKKALMSVEDTWGTYLIPFTGALTASIVHAFYTQKIWTLLDTPFNYIFTAVVLSLSCLQLVAGLGWTALVFHIEPDLSELHRIKTWSYLWLVPASIADIIITAVITWKLSSSRTGYKDTDDILSKLIRLTIETGLATAIVQLSNLVFFLRWPFKTYDIFSGMISAKMYSNSMLALLNSRQPRERSGTFHIHDGQIVQTAINIHTTQRVDVASDYELGHRQKSKASSSSDVTK